jgi:hypothetical protein
VGEEQSEAGTALTLGDTVVISPDAPQSLRPGSRGWVVVLPSPNRELFTVEYADGTSAEVPPHLVEKSADS